MKTFQAPFFICSIGNLTVGGTGKTPFLHWLISYLRKRGKKVWVVGHGYGGKTSQVTQVNLSQPRDQLYEHHGDESTWLAYQHPETPVYTGPSKGLVVKTLADKKKAERGSQKLTERKEDKPWILLDDGFQHWRLHRHLDFVLLDATQKMADYAPLPLGKAREGWSALQRAHLVVLTKANFVSKEKIQKIIKRIPQGLPYTALAYDLKSFLHLSSGQRVKRDALQGQIFWALSAIGNPASFTWILEKRAKIALKKHFILTDHSPYLPKKLRSLQETLKHQEAKKNQDTEEVKGLIITEKDATKIWHQRKDFPKVWIAEMKILPYDKINKLPSIYERLQDIF